MELLRRQITDFTGWLTKLLNMKIKSLLLSLLLLPVALFGATNAFDNVTVTTSSKQAGITRFLTNGINGVTVGIWSNGQFGVGQAINPASGFLVDMHQFQDGQTKIRLSNTNTGTSVSTIIQIKADASDGIQIGVVGQNFSGSTPGSTAEIYSGVDIENFMFLTQRAGAPFFFRTSTGEKFRISDAAGVLVTNANFKATQNATIVSNLFVGGTITATNSGVTNLSSATKFFATPPSGDHMYFADTSGNILGLIQTNAFNGFRIAVTNNGPSLSFRASTGLIMVTNSDFEVTGNTLLDGNTTLGNAAVDTITANASTYSAPNTLNFNSSTFYITNGVSAFGTNSTLVTEVVRIQNTVAAGSGLVIQNNAAPTSANRFISFRGPTGTEIASVTSNGGFASGAGVFTSTGVSLVNAGGIASIANASASANSVMQVTGGTGAGSSVLLVASSVTLGSFKTNVITFTGADQVRINTGQRILRVQTGTNYNIRQTDFYIAVKGTTATVQTNFLPALGGLVADGTMFRIKDAQQSATTTNIVIMPAGSDKIDNASSLTFSVSGSSKLFIYDGVSNWETQN